MSTRREQHRAHVDPPRVVVVDDEPLARRRMRDLLAGAPGVSLAAECRNGTSAVDAIASVRPDVVLLDIEMPGRDAWAWPSCCARSGTTLRSSCS